MAIEGAPGGGKTTICEEVANELKVGFIEKHMPTMLVEDFGIMYPNGDDMLHYKLPDWYPSQDRTDIPDTGILCFDDRNQANADLQKVLANICQARNLHGVPLKEGWMVVSTGNRQLTEQVLIVYCLTCVIVRLCMNLKHTLMTGVHGLLTTE